ncbi:MAG: zincin-like metallopeptidase domain-containing protein [Patescibacteria group bacterium]
MSRTDVYETVTNAIASAIEKGFSREAFEMPWHGMSDIPQNASTQKRYRGINVPLLWITQLDRGFKSGIWATYKQWAELGAQVRKGEKSTQIIFWKQFETEQNEEAEEENKIRMFARYSQVFNADQVDGFTLPEAAKPAEIDQIEACTNFLNATGAIVEHGGARAYYDLISDKIHLPQKSLFCATKHSTATENYYSTLLHELTHWSGATIRLNRFNINNCADKKDYAFEELVAELGAAILCASLGVTSTPRPDHAHYIGSWLKALGNDKKFIFAAASAAQKAVDYLYSLQAYQVSPELAEAA